MDKGGRGVPQPHMGQYYSIVAAATNIKVHISDNVTTVAEALY